MRSSIRIFPRKPIFREPPPEEVPSSQGHERSWGRPRWRVQRRCCSFMSLTLITPIALAGSPHRIHKRTLHRRIDLLALFLQTSECVPPGIAYWARS